MPVINVNVSVQSEQGQSLAAATLDSREAIRAAYLSLRGLNTLLCGQLGGSIDSEGLYFLIDGIANELNRNLDELNKHIN